MKVYLACFWEEKNFGPGRLIGVVSGKKPSNIDVKLVFKQLAPSSDVIDLYNREKLQDINKAFENFKKSYEKQLSDFTKAVKEKCKVTGLSPQETLPFQEGDTLASYEKRDRSHYRKFIEKVLVELGYEVVSN